MANIGPNEPPKLVGNEFGKCFCVLCNEIIEVFKNVVLVCTHSFHENCLKNWKKDICPICRKPQEIFEVFPTKATSSKPPRRHPTGDVNHLMHSEITLENLEEKYSPQFEKAWTSEKVKDLVPKTLFNEAKKSLHVANKLMQEKKFEQSYAMVMRCDHLMEVVRECSEFYTFLRN
uniref:RING-type domain-containing protein n=1 Tax=Panagrolaimus sp. JU765 TaxID=591449 RepID=A0AC34RL61_9BILA